MIQEAIEKINTEMAKENKEYVNLIGNELIRIINNNEDAAVKIMAAGTIVDSIKEMTKVAKTKAVGNCAVLTDKEGMDIVKEYFGIKDIISIKNNIVPLYPVAQETKVSKSSQEKFDIDLDDLF